MPRLVAHDGGTVVGIGVLTSNPAETDPARAKIAGLWARFHEGDVLDQLPPALAVWMRATTAIECLPVRDLNLHRASDAEIFVAARSANAVALPRTPTSSDSW